MIKKIVSFSVYHPVSVLMLHLALALCCCISLTLIRLDFMPKIGERFLLVATDFTGVNADDMRSLVTLPVEDAAASLKGIKNISSVTRDGLSLVIVELHWNVDAELALTECREIIDRCYETLPNGCTKPSASVFNPVHRELLTLAVLPHDDDLEYARHIVDTDIRPHLQRVKGVASVSVTGGVKSEVQVRLDKAKLEALPLSLQSAADILTQSNFEYPSGHVRDGNKELLFRTSGLFTSLDDIADTPVFYGNSGVLKIKDIGTAAFGTEKKQSFFMYNGKEALCVKIYKKADASPLSISKKLIKEISELERLYGGNFAMKVIFDSSDELTSSIKNLCATVIVGAIISALVLFLFLRSLRISFLAASVMPLSIIFSVFVLSLCGKTINVLSVSGITIGIGMVIDPAAVAIENISEKIKRQPKGNIANAIIQGVSETALSASGSAITTIAAFSPLFFFPGLFGKLFSDMAAAVIASIAFSFVLAMTYIPAMTAFRPKILIAHSDASAEVCCSHKMVAVGFNTRCYDTERRGIKPSARIKLCRTDPCVAYFEKVYGDCLKTVFARKHTLFIFLSGCIFIGTLSAVFLKKEALPNMPGTVLSATVRYGASPSLDALFSDAAVIHRLLSADTSVDTVCISGGIEKDDYGFLADPGAKKETLRITCSGKNPDKIVSLLNKILQKADMPYTIENSRNLLEETLASEGASIIMTDSSPEAVRESALDICDERDIVPYDILSEAVFVPDRSACARFSLPPSKTAAAVYAALEGVPSNVFYRNGRKIPLRVSFTEGTYTALEDILDTSVVSGKSAVPLSALGKIERRTNEKILFRWNRKDAKKINNITGGKTTDAFAAERRNIKDAERVTNLAALIPLRDMRMKELFKSAAVLLVVVFLLLYCIMGAQFESFIVPLLMFVSIPPAFAGAFFLLLVCRRSLNINGIIALVVLFGTAVNNAIILYESIVRLKKLTEDGVIAASVSKLRSILITTLTTICAVFPFAFDPFRKNQQSSMAVAIIGGLSVSFVVVLAVMPPLFRWVLGKRRKA